MEYSICGGKGGCGRVIFYMFSATHQNASNAFLSHFRHFYFFLSIFGLLRGKNKNVLELPKIHFKDIKKVEDFPYVRGEEGVSTNIWKIPYVFSRYFLKAFLTQKVILTSFHQLLKVGGGGWVH